MAEDEFKKMTFVEHFEELRRRLFRCVISVVIAFVVCFCFKDWIVARVLAPYDSLREKMQKAVDAGEEGAYILKPMGFIGPTEGFIFYLKACFFAAVLFSAPFILYQMWRFIASGLYRKERGAVMRVLPFSICLFMTGMVFGYLLLFPIGLQFLLTFPDPDHFEASIAVGPYFSLFTLLILLMGFIFQTPLIMVVTTWVEMTDVRFFTSKRKFFVVGAFVLSALLTPPDYVTQCLLAGPLIVLFELGICLCRLVERKQKKREAKSDPETKAPPAEETA